MVPAAGRCLRVDAESGGAYYDPSYGTPKVTGPNRNKLYEDGALAGFGEALPPSTGTGVRRNDRSAGSAAEINYTVDP